jgi:hypothetical protein
MKLVDSLILFGSLAFLVMWVDQIYKGVAMKDSYFFLMFSLAGFLFYVYRRGQRKIEEQKHPEKKPKSNKKNK